MTTLVSVAIGAGVLLAYLFFAVFSWAANIVIAIAGVEDAIDRQTRALLERQYILHLQWETEDQEQTGR